MQRAASGKSAGGKASRGVGQDLRVDLFHQRYGLGRFVTNGIRHVSSIPMLLGRGASVETHAFSGKPLAQHVDFDVQVGLVFQ